MNYASKHYVNREARDEEEAAKMNSAEYKESFMKMASTAISASKTGWTRARQVFEYFYNLSLFRTPFYA